MGVTNVATSYDLPEPLGYGGATLAPVRAFRMTDHLQKLLAKARTVEMSPQQREQQRRSFAFGNANIENERVTREMVEQVAAEQLRER